MTRMYDIPARRVEKEINFSIGTISASSDEMPCLVAGTNLEILSAHIVDTSGITANDTNYWTIAMKNKGSDGTGTDSIICSVTTKTSDSGGGTGDIAAFDAQSLGAITNGLLNKGDVASITATKASGAPDTDNMLLVVRVREI